MSSSYNPYPYGSAHNPVVVASIITTYADYDVLVADSQIVTRNATTTAENPACQRFFLEIPFDFAYGVTKRLVFSDNAGTTLYSIYDKLGNYVREDSLIGYAGVTTPNLRPRLIECIYLNDPAHVTILSPLCRSHYVAPTTTTTETPTDPVTPVAPTVATLKQVKKTVDEV